MAAVKKQMKTNERTKGKPASRKNGYAIKGRLWVEGKSGTFISFGRVVLLERVRRYGSITNAAKSMKISYRHAWELVDSMNSQSKKPLVKTATGGKNGGGAKLTETGHAAIVEFWTLYKKLARFLDRENASLKF